MGLWNFYFLAKLYLYFKGFIRLGFFWNLLFLLFLIIPAPKQHKYYRLLMVVKYSLSLVFGLLLLWRDSWFPPLLESIASLNRQGWPSKGYMYRFLAGSFNPLELIVVVFILIFCLIATKYIRLTPVVIVLLLIVPLSEFGQSMGDTEKYLDAFYKSESGKVINFEKSKNDDPDFDIIILHICSLSWDDLKGVGIGKDDTFFKQFDYLLTDFNSVTTHSNPSAIRLLRANCGQQGHGDLYNEAPAECYLFESLRMQGYERYFTLNHDGTYGNFAEEVRLMGRLSEPLKPAGIPIQAYNFDGSAIFDDYHVLERWWMTRQESNVKRAMVYYNTISLHEGAHWSEDKDWWKNDRRLDNYKGFVQKLFRDTTKFIDLIASSGRNAVVIFIPEHGMALQSNILQPAGLREIPLPQITRVPVGIKLIGKGYNSSQPRPIFISKSTSYLSVSYLLASIIKENPFNPGAVLSGETIENTPATEFVSENEAARILKRGEGYFLYDKRKQWIKLSESSLQ